MKPVGGYFGLELAPGTEYHLGCWAVNTGRNALELILRSNAYTRVYVPSYVCDAVLEVFEKTQTEYSLYGISSDLRPLIPETLGKTEALLYVNYFGAAGEIVRDLANQYRNLIVDNTQAFFERPIDGVNTFYSCRKFFGVADGGYAFSTAQFDEKLEQDTSLERMQHLLARTEGRVADGFVAFQENERALCGKPIREMSQLTQSIMQAINYPEVRRKRVANFEVLHAELGNRNELVASNPKLHSLFTYPMLSSKPDLRKRLIEHQIFVPTYWESVRARVTSDSVEHRLTTFLLPLPIDQRYGVADMMRVAETVKSLL